MRKVGWSGKLSALAASLVVCLSSCGPSAPEVGQSSDAATSASPGATIFPVAADGSIDTSVIAEFEFTESAYDFGSVDAPTPVQHRFVFKNVGTQPLRIQHARSACGCTVADYPSTPIAPQDTGSVLVRFDTEGRAGPQVKPVTLTANTYPSATTVTLRGIVRGAD